MNWLPTLMPWRSGMILWVMYGKSLTHFCWILSLGLTRMNITLRRRRRWQKALCQHSKRQRNSWPDSSLSSKSIGGTSKSIWRSYFTRDWRTQSSLYQTLSNSSTTITPSSTLNCHHRLIWECSSSTVKAAELSCCLLPRNSFRKLKNLCQRLLKLERTRQRNGFRSVWETFRNQ